MNYCEYNELTGQILSLGSGPDTLNQESFAHFTNPVLLGISSLVQTSTHYVEGGHVESFPLKPGEHYSWNWESKEWVLDLITARATKAAQIDSSCRVSILSGFTSLALGEEHHYPAKLTDQANLSGSIIDSLLPGLAEDWVTPFWCEDSKGVWEFRPHSAIQIQQVGRDAKQAILDSTNRNELLQSRIVQANSLEELDQIVW